MTVPRLVCEISIHRSVSSQRARLPERSAEHKSPGRSATWNSDSSNRRSGFLWSASILQLGHVAAFVRESMRSAAAAAIRCIQAESRPPEMIQLTPRPETMDFHVLPASRIVIHSQSRTRMRTMPAARKKSKPQESTTRFDRVKTPGYTKSLGLAESCGQAESPSCCNVRTRRTSAPNCPTIATMASLTMPRIVQCCRLRSSSPRTAAAFASEEVLESVSLVSRFGVGVSIT
jgi:hypothetical protein